MLRLSAERLTGFSLGFAAVGVVLTGWLVISELLVEPTCPELVGIPACTIVLGGYLAALAGAWWLETRAGRALFLAGAGVVTVVGVWFSANELAGALSCPTFEGLPMCYVSLLAGLTILAADQVRARVA